MMTSSPSPPDSAGILLLLAGVLVAPELADNLAGAGEPFFIAPELLQRFGREMFDAVARGIAEWF